MCTFQANYFAATIRRNRIVDFVTPKLTQMPEIGYNKGKT